MGRLDNTTYLKDSNPFWEYFRESKHYVTIGERVRSLKQPQNISVLHALNVSHFKGALISSQVSLQLLW